MIAISGFYRRTARRTLALSGLLTALALGAAHAQVTQAQIGAVKANCRSDYMAHCMSVRPGGKEALQCLQSHLASLTGTCKSAVAATMPQAAPPPAAAAPPAPPKTKAVKAAPPPPHPKAAAVPPPKAAAAPPPPKAAAVPPPSKAAIKEAIKQHCRSDYMAHCMGVPPGGTQALHCLQSHVGGLSGACRRAVAATMPSQPAAPAHRRAHAMPSAPVAIEPPAAAEPDPAILAARAAQLPLRERLAVFRACNQDQAAVCPAVRRGRGRLIACLAMHADALSAFCRRAVARAMQ